MVIPKYERRQMTSLIFFSTKVKNLTNSNLITCLLEMPNTNQNSVPTYASFLLTSALLLGGSILIPTIYAEDDEDDDYKGNLAQEVKQKQKCKIGVFGDPQQSHPRYQDSATNKHKIMSTQIATWVEQEFPWDRNKFSQ